MKVAQDFEDFYAQRAQKGAESTSDLLVVTTDGKGIVMHSKDLREATAKAAKKATQSRPTRLSPGPKRQRKRMATVASVYSVPRFERRPEDGFCSCVGIRLEGRVLLFRAGERGSRGLGDGARIANTPRQSQ